MKGEDILCCAFCVKKRKGYQKADSYCTQCDNKFCTKHLESHDDLFESHKTISIETYKTQGAKVQMMCEVHNDQPCCGGCKKCFKFICFDCLFCFRCCINGGTHQLMALDELVKMLKKEINYLKEKMMDKEETWYELFKLTSKKISEYDDATKEMVELIHQTRDKQVEALKEKYRKLEEELMQARLKVRADMMEFLDINVEENWSRLRNYRQTIDARLKHSHQCDIVSGYRETFDEIQRLIDDPLPTLNIPKCTSLSTGDKCRDIELDILSVEGVQIDSQTIPISPPTSLTLLNTVQLADNVSSVFSYKGNTYVGVQDDSITKINERFNHTCFIRFYGHVSGLAVYKDKVYSISYGSPCKVHVFDLSGGLLQWWALFDFGTEYGGLVVCSDQLVVPDRNNKQIVVYTLTESVVNRISCAQISAGNWVSLCAVGDNSVVVSNYDTGEVFKVNISSGEIKWTYAKPVKTEFKPQGVTCYREKYVLVASAGSDTLDIIDVHTGKVMSQITNQHICGSGDLLYDMHISGNTLVIANYDTCSVVFFQLNL